MKKKVIFSFILFFLLVSACYCHILMRQSSGESLPLVPAPSPDTILPSQTAPPALRLYAAEACLMDASSGRILYGKECDTPLPMASTTKIMTCLLAIESGKMSDPVSFSERACRMPKVHLGAQKGSVFSLEDLLYSLMLESHNDTAVAIAEYIGGSVEGFAAMMNAKATELNLTSTFFITPNGLDEGNHSSSPSDMCRLAAYACQNEVFLHIVNTPSKTIRTIDQSHCYSLTNRDAFLNTYPGALGIKTGFTNKAGYCFVGAARREHITLTSCVLASGWPPNKSYKWADTASLMDYGFQYYSYRSLPIRDLTTHQIPVHNGQSDYVSLTQPDIPEFLLSDFDCVTLSYDIPTHLCAPIRSDVSLGKIEVQINDTTVGIYPLYPASSIQEKDLLDFCFDALALFLDF